jgi:hypothetical protein
MPSSRATSRVSARVRLNVAQSGRLGDRFRQRHAPGVEGKLALASRRTEGQEGPRFTIDIDRVLRMYVDVVRGFVDQGAEGDKGALALALEHDPGLIALT